jgi:hypothetical protein
MTTDQEHTLRTLLFSIKDAQYEKRTVAFYDVLGWRNKINRAGIDSRKLAELQKIVLMFALFSESATFRAEDVRVSTFSDNVVVSCPVDSTSVGVLFTRLSMVQVRAALSGFLIRGGITIGDIFHDERVVFGPALVKAYAIESEVANYPRLVLDREATELAKHPDLAGFAVDEAGVLFLDPFRIDFWQSTISWLASSSDFRYQDEIREEGDALLQFRIICAGLEQQMKEALVDREYAKIRWLWERLTDEIILCQLPDTVALAFRAKMAKNRSKGKPAKTHRSHR